MCAKADVLNGVRCDALLAVPAEIAVFRDVTSFTL